MGYAVVGFFVARTSGVSCAAQAATRHLPLKRVLRRPPFTEPAFSYMSPFRTTVLAAEVGCVANECRSVWRVARFVIPLRRTADS